MLIVGKIYACDYFKYKNDPRPLLFVIGASVNYTEGLNVNYLNPPEQQTLAGLIMKYGYMFRDTGITGKLLYLILKKDIYKIINKCYRKYHSSNLRGYLVSNGIRFDISERAVKNLVYTAKPFVKYLENIKKPEVFPLQKQELDYKKNIVNKLMVGKKIVKDWWQKTL
jgi:hypothetical protein